MCDPFAVEGESGSHSSLSQPIVDTRQPAMTTSVARSTAHPRDGRRAEGGDRVARRLDEQVVRGVT
jgi:hypothetical protein